VSPLKNIGMDSDPGFAFPLNSPISSKAEERERRIWLLMIMV